MATEALTTFVEAVRDTDETAAIRVRCALGLIITSVLGPQQQQPDSACAPAYRLTEAEKQFVTAAALAVLAVPVP